MRISPALAVLLVATPLAAQGPSSPPAGAQIVDRVVAIVGDTTLLLSDVTLALQQYRDQGGTIPTDPVERNALAERMLEARVNDLILVQAALQAGIEPDQTRIQDQVEQQIESVRSSFPTEAQFTQALAASGRSLEEYRAEVTAQTRDQALEQMYVQQQLADRTAPLISEDQLQAAFAQQKASLGTRPTRVAFEQVIVTPQPTDSAQAKALATARDVLQQLKDGGDFEVLAKRYSDDPGSKESGGDLGWFKRGTMVKEFEDAAFSMRPGQTSGIVKTDYGYHIIRLDKVLGGERSAHHILIRPEITSADVTRAEQSADSVAAAIRAGASVTDLAATYDTDPEAITVALTPITSLPSAYSSALGTAAADSVVGPITVSTPTGTTYAIVKVTSRQAAGEYTLDDVRQQLTYQLQQQQMNDQLVDELRGKIFVKIMM